MNIDLASSATANSVTNNNDTAMSLRSQKGCYFFVAMAILFPVIAAIGFAPSYQADE